MTATVAAAAVAFGANAASAVTNGGFEGLAFNDWNATGQVGTFNNFKNMIDPTEGSAQVIMFTDRFSVQNRNSAASDSQLSDAIGTDVSEALNGRFVRNGSVVAQSFTVNEPSTLTFDWAFAHRNDAFVTGNDVAFVIIDGQTIVLTELENTDFTLFGDDAFIGTEYVTSGPIELEAGVHDIVFGVAAVDATSGRSALLVDNVQLTSLDGLVGEPDGEDVFPPPTGGGVVANPEPVTAALVGLALGAAGVATRRRRNHA